LLEQEVSDKAQFAYFDAFKHRETPLRRAFLRAARPSSERSQGSANLTIHPCLNLRTVIVWPGILNGASCVSSLTEGILGVAWPNLPSIRGR
jgi:hypothetical protein